MRSRSHALRNVHSFASFPHSSNPLRENSQYVESISNEFDTIIHVLESQGLVRCNKWSIMTILVCGMELLIHATLQWSLKLGHGRVINSHCFHGYFTYLCPNHDASSPDISRGVNDTLVYGLLQSIIVKNCLCTELDNILVFHQSYLNTYGRNSIKVSIPSFLSPQWSPLCVPSDLGTHLCSTRWCV